MTIAPSSVTRLAPGLHRIALGFVNAYLIDTDGELTLIDSGFPIDGPEVLGAIASLGYPASALRRIALTHGHLDHLGGAEDVRRATGARVLLSEIDAGQVENGIMGHAPMHTKPGFEELVAEQVSDPEYLRRLDGKGGTVPHPITPLRIDGHLVAGAAVEGLPDSELLPTPGHCRGQLSILVRRHGGWLFTGDAAVNFGGPIMIAPIAEDLDLAERSLESLKRQDFEVAAFGHGEPITSGAAAVFRG